MGRTPTGDPLSPLTATDRGVGPDAAEVAPQSLHLRRRPAREPLPARRPRPPRQPAQRRYAGRRTRDFRGVLRELGFTRTVLATISSPPGASTGCPARPQSTAAASRRRGVRRHGRDPETSGIYFICLGASIARQFEFVQKRLDGRSEIRRPEERRRRAARAIVGPGWTASRTDVFVVPQPDGPVRRILRSAAVRHGARRGVLSSCPGFARCVTSRARDEERRHGFEHEPPGATRNTGSAALNFLSERRCASSSSSAVSIRGSGRCSTRCCASRWRRSSMR